jgi:hypothetical protein
MKGMVMPGTLFEEMGFNYIGPIDGHDFDTLVATLQNMRNMTGPRLLHVVTQKGGVMSMLRMILASTMGLRHSILTPARWKNTAVA